MGGMELGTMIVLPLSALSSESPLRPHSTAESPPSISSESNEWGPRPVSFPSVPADVLFGRDAFSSESTLVYVSLSRADTHQLHQEANGPPPRHEPIKAPCKVPTGNRGSSPLPQAIEGPIHYSSPSPKLSNNPSRRPAIVLVESSGLRH